MKRITITTLVFLTGMAVFAQSADMSFYTEEYNRLGNSFIDRLVVLENVRDAGLTGIGEFYHEALKVLLAKNPDIKNKEDKDATEASAKIICQGLGAEKYSAAAPELWQLVQDFDVINSVNDGLCMQEALIALGQVGGNDFLSHIVLRLDDFNAHPTSDVETKRRVQRGVVGAVNALEALHEPDGFRPVFFTSTGWYDPVIKAMASVALPNIVEDPGDIISGIILDNSNNPAIKYEAWREMLRTQAPNTSKAKVAATALAVGWSYSSNQPMYQRNLKEMRMSAIDTIRVMGVADNSVYTNLERSYNNNFVNNIPDYDEIRKTIDTLSAVKTDESVQLLSNFLKELHDRRRSGPWGNKERQILQLVIPALGATGTQSPEVRVLLTTIQRSQDYTGAEQMWARNALRALNQ